MPNPIDQIIFSRMNVPRLQTVLDLTVTRQKLLTENVANAETPGYRRQDIDFKTELKRAADGQPSGALRATRPEHIGATPASHSPKVEREDLPDDQPFGVDIDREMGQVAKNQLEFNVAAKLIGRKFDGLRTVIRGRT